MLFKGARVSVLFFLLALFFTNDLSVASAPSIQLRSFTSHSRLSIRVDEGVEYQWKDSAQGFELFLKGYMLSDLGAPLGGESEWLANQTQRGSLKDDRLDGVTFVERGTGPEGPAGLMIRGRWKWPSGDLAPAQPKMEHFSYVDSKGEELGSGIRLVVDFWPKAGPTVAEVRRIEKEKKREAARMAARSLAKRRVERKIASEQSQRKAEDLARFCQEPITEATEAFLQLKPHHEPVNFGRWISTTTPDSNYIYLEPDPDSEGGNRKDAQYVRLALRLYRQGNPALVVRTLNFFEKEYPGSSFRYEMKLLRASALVKVGQPDEATRILQDLVSTANTSPVALPAGMYIAVQNYLRGAYLISLENFLWLTHYFPGHRLEWVFHLGAAESLYAMKQADRASKEYQWVALNAPEEEAQAEAALRVGDLYLDRLQYERALAAYYLGLKRYSNESKKFPAVHINRAETLYGLEQWERAEEGFKEFLENYPAHPAGWRAALRLAEIQARRGDRAAANAGFLETVNRYPFTPGAVIARAWMIPCGNHAGFSANNFANFFKNELGPFQAPEVDGTRLPTFKFITEIRTMLSFDKFAEAVDLIAKVSQNKQSKIRPETMAWAQGLQANLVRREVLRLLHAGENYKALTYYEEQSKQMEAASPGALDSVDPDFLLNLSQEAAKLGLGPLAVKLSDRYTKNLPDRVPASLKNPFEDGMDLELKLKSSEERVTRALALWSGGQKNPEEIRKLVTGIPEESEFAYPALLVSALLDQKQGNPRGALAAVLKAQLQLSGRKTSSPDEASRIAYWIAQLQRKVGDPIQALDLLKTLEKAPVTPVHTGTLASLGVAAVPRPAALALEQGDILSALGKWGEAAVAYGRAREDKDSGGQASYEYARALIKGGSTQDQEKAREELRKLAGGPEGFWKKMAREALANSDFQPKAKEGNP